MDKKIKTIQTGLIISGLGMVLTPLFANKVLIIINTLIFIGFVIANMMQIFESRGLTLKDLDTIIEQKMSQSYQEKQYANFFLYTSIRPIIMISLVVSFLYMITFLIF